MKIAILGTGMVGRSLSSRFLELGHTVIMGTRDVKLSLLNTDNVIDGDTLKQWADNHENIILESFSNAVEQAEIIWVAIQGEAIEPMLSMIESSLFDKKIVVDVSNYLTFSREEPLPSLKYTGNSSLGEELQKMLSNSYVVKTLNHIEHSIMVSPNLVSGDHTTFMAGNDKEAKILVKELLYSFGWKKNQVIDLGMIEFSRAIEAMLLIWCRVYQLLGTGNFNFELNISDQ